MRAGCSRRIEMHYLGGQTKMIADLVVRPGANKSLSKMWTGVTRFEGGP